MIKTGTMQQTGYELQTEKNHKMPKLVPSFYVRNHNAERKNKLCGIGKKKKEKSKSKAQTRCCRTEEKPAAECKLKILCMKIMSSEILVKYPTQPEALLVKTYLKL